jgi:uncharacterized membrane protein
MRTRSEQKAAALAKCRFNWTPLVLATLVYVAVTAASAATTFAAVLVEVFLLNPITVGLYISFLAYDRDQTQDNLIESMFRKAFDKNYLHKVLGFFLMGLFICLWSLLLIVPGIIKAYAYAMTPFILEENPEMPAYDAIKYSEKMMKGHKWDLFVLGLSFLGWMILACLTFGIGFLWLTPYMTLSVCEFYEDLKAEQADKPLEGTVN